MHTLSFAKPVVVSLLIAGLGLGCGEGDVGPSGPSGPTGPTGLTGETPDFGTILSSEQLEGTESADGSVGTATAECAVDSYATGGGCALVITGTAGAVVKQDEPDLTGVLPTGWSCTCQAIAGSTCTVTATAVCLQ